LHSKTLKSTALLISMKFIERFIGIISTLILARLLIPEDFGIVAIVLLSINFFDAISVAGTEQYIIQKNMVSSQDLNTAWSLDILLKTIMVLMLILLAVFIAEFYEKPQLTLPIQIMSVTLLIRASINPEIYLLKKTNQYRTIFNLSVVQKFLMATTTITMALYFQSFWALVIGHVVNVVVLCVGSYVICKFRPKFTLINFKDQFYFSKWSLLKSIFGYVGSQIDTILVGKIHDIASLGAYHNMKYLSSMPYTQLIEPGTTPLFATFAAEKNNFRKTQYFFDLSFFMIISFGIPLCVFSVIFSKEIVLTLLGDQWVEYASLFGIFSIFILSQSIASIAQSLCLSRGFVKLLFWFDVISCGLVILTIYLTYEYSLETFAFCRSVLSLLIISGLAFFITHKLSLSFIEPLKFLFVVTMLAVCSYLVILGINQLYFEESMLYNFIKMFIFLISYGLLFLLWIKLSKAESPEYIRNKVKELRHKFL
jgi:lipopolysaccharide exporter